MFSKFGDRISRRDALKLGILAAATLGMGLPLSALTKSAIAQDLGSEQLGFLFNQELCINCKACERACRSANQEARDEQVNWRRVLDNGGDEDEGHFLSISCNHCAEPACLTVCPVTAYTKRKDGIVLHNAEKCVGCGYCMYACPYHSPQYSQKTKRVTKCHFCYSRQDQGQQPACVEVCPKKALLSGKLSELKKIPGGVATLEGLPSPTITNPSWVIIPKV